MRDWLSRFYSHNIIARILIGSFFCLAFFVSFILCAAFYMVVRIFFKRQSINSLEIFLARLILFCSGQKLIIKGKQPDYGKSFIYVANHESFFDGYLAVAAIKGGFFPLVSGLYAERPFLKQLFRVFGAVSIKSSKHPVSSEMAKDKIKPAKELLNQKQSLLIFPEGARTPDGEMKPFKLGAFFLAKETGVSVVPCALFGARQAWRRGSWLIKPGEIVFVFGDPVNCSEQQSPADFAMEVGRLVKCLYLDEFFQAIKD